MHVNMCWIGPMWPKCTFGDVIGNKDMPFTDLPDHETKKLRAQKIEFGLLFTFYLSKSDF